MAYQNGTTHYNLPQTVGTDKRDWSDTNKAFADIDAALYNAAESSTNNKTTIDRLVLDVNQNTQDIDTNKANIATNTANIGTNTGDIATLKGDVQTMQTDLHSEIADARNDAEDMITAYNEPNATSAHQYAVGDYFIYNDILYKATKAIAVGDTIVPNTNCTATNVTTELNNKHTQLIYDIPEGDTRNYAAILAELYSEFYSTLNALSPEQLAGISVFHKDASYLHQLSSFMITPTYFQFIDVRGSEQFNEFSITQYYCGLTGKYIGSAISTSGVIISDNGTTTRPSTPAQFIFDIPNA